MGTKKCVCLQHSSRFFVTRFCIECCCFAWASGRKDLSIDRSRCDDDVDLARISLSMIRACSCHGGGMVWISLNFS